MYTWKMTKAYDSPTALPLLFILILSKTEAELNPEVLT